MLRYLVLGLLRGGDHVHGYALWKAYERRSGQMIQSGKFYRALKDLTQGGLVRPLSPPEEDPRRTPYEITPSGSGAFDGWIVSLDALENPGRDEISSRGLFALDLAPDVAEAFFAALDDLLSSRWKRLEHDRERALSRPGLGESERAIQSLMLMRDLEHTSADLNWLREIKARYEMRQKALSMTPPAATESLERPRVRNRGR